MANETSPSNATHHANVVIGQTYCPDHGTKCRRDDCMHRFGTQTSYFDTYFDSKPSTADLGVPDGWYVLERSVRQTPLGRERSRASRASR